MPVYNEKATVSHAVARVREVGMNAEIICVDDCSTDGTRDVLQLLLDSGEIDHLVFHEKNRGKGAAIRTALERVAMS
jgi:glycosyltransferase involved in cell wall biosynthesis